MKNKRKIFTVLFIIALLVYSFFLEDGFLKTPNNMDLKLVSEKQEAIEKEDEVGEIYESKNKEVVAEREEPTQANVMVDNEVYQESDKSEEEPPDEIKKEVLEAEISEVREDSEGIDSLYCTLTVECSSVLKNYDKLKENKREIIPKDGIILPETTVEFSADESVFDVLLRELKNRKIQIDFVSAPMYNSVYIRGLANLYEFDCGNLSGWFYKVNGEKPTFGCSQYKLKNHDKIEFYYTCNMFE